MCLSSIRDVRRGMCRVDDGESNQYGLSYPFFICVSFALLPFTTNAMNGGYDFYVLICIMYFILCVYI